MMENTILFEDMEYSVTSAPYDYNNSFIDNFKQQYNFDIDQLIIDGRIIKIEEKPINEKRGWHYFGKNKFEVIKTELNEFYKIIDPERLRLNPHLIDQIRYNTEEKKADIEKLQQQLLNIENNPISFANDCWEYSDVESWLYVINKIVEQPLYIIEVIEKYPESIEENQRIYFRHGYVGSKIEEAKDRHKESFSHMQFKYMMTVKMGRGIDIKPLIYFFEGLIDELLIYNSGIDYIDTPLFRMLFSEFNVYYSREISKYDSESFPNIEQVKKRLNELKPQQIEIPDQESKAITDQPETNSLQPQQSEKPKKPFSEYLLHSKPDKLAIELKNQFSTEKGKGIRLMIDALQKNEPQLLSVGKRQMKEICEALQIFFGRNLGTYQSINDCNFDEIDLQPTKTKIDFILKTINQSISKS